MILYLQRHKPQRWRFIPRYCSRLTQLRINQGITINQPSLSQTHLISSLLMAMVIICNYQPPRINCWAQSQHLPAPTPLLCTLNVISLQTHGQGLAAWRTERSGFISSTVNACNMFVCIYTYICTIDITFIYLLFSYNIYHHILLLCDAILYPCRLYCAICHYVIFYHIIAYIISYVVSFIICHVYIYCRFPEAEHKTFTPETHMTTPGKKKNIWKLIFLVKMA